MQVPHFIKIACKKIYKDEENSIIAYWKLVQKYEDNPERIFRKVKGNGQAETYHSEEEITDIEGNVKEVREFRVDLYDNNHDIPVLVIFANKLLKIARDFFENIKFTSKFHSLLNFFELFYNLAWAGPEMKNYMLQNKFVSRLLDLYFDKNSKNKHEMRDLSYMPMYELFWNNRPKLVMNSDEDSDKIDKKDFDFGLKLLILRNENDDLIVEKEKKSHYRSNYTEEDGGEVGFQQLSHHGEPFEK